MPDKIDWPHLKDKSYQCGLGSWSYSKLRIAENCPRLFQSLYLVKSHHGSGVIFKDPSAAVGTFIHEVFAESINTLLTEEVFLKRWKDIRIELKLLSDERLQANRLRRPTFNLLQRLQTAARKHGAVYSPELKVEYELLHGILDLDVKMNDIVGGVIDYKTHAASKRTIPKVQDQLGFYVLLKFLSDPLLHAVRAGAVYIPDEDVRFNKYVYRDSDFPCIENSWYQRVHLAVSTMASFIQSNTVVFPEAAKKTDLCKWCNLTCKRSKIGK